MLSIYIFEVSIKQNKMEIKRIKAGYYKGTFNGFAFTLIKSISYEHGFQQGRKCVDWVLKYVVGEQVKVLSLPTKKDALNEFQIIVKKLK